MYNRPSHNHLILYMTKLVMDCNKISIFVVPNCNKINMSYFPIISGTLGSNRKFSQEKLAESLKPGEVRQIWRWNFGGALWNSKKYISVLPHQYWSVAFGRWCVKYPWMIWWNSGITGYCCPLRWIGGDSFIEIVPHKARAGYLSGYSDPEFIESLQHTLPCAMGNSELLPVDGDCPIKAVSLLWAVMWKNCDVMDGKTYILLTKNEGIVYKRLNKTGKCIAFIRIMPIINPMK
jgi:hypothetical protein